MTALRLPPGHVIAGKYWLRAPLGYGGASASYAAATAAGRSVVIKLFSPQLADRGEVLSALQRAATVTNALPADATLPILDVGFDPQTRSPFTVTDAAPVPSLLEVVRAGPLSPPDVALVIRGIAAALDVAQAQRLVHGGLKPQNVFVGTSPQRPVKVIDFGASVARAALPTDEGRAVAAPWIAPEQAQGAPETPAVDVFSAALVAFFAVTGRPYWRSCQAAMPELGGWLHEIGATRVPASVRARELGAVVPEAWDPVFARALAHNPAERFGSVSELANALASTTASPFAAAAAPQDGASPAMLVAASDTPDGPPRSRTGLVVVLALAGIVAVAAAVAIAMTLRKPPSAAVAVASSVAMAPLPAPSASGVASAAPSAEPSQDAEAPAASASETPAQQMAQLTVTCVPDCDTVTIDDDVLDAGLTDPQALPPGVHTLVAARASFITQTRKVTLKAGQREKASFFLARPGPVAPKPCGKFLERCP